MPEENRKNRNGARGPDAKEAERAASVSAADAEEINQVRELLFGNQVRRLREHFTAEVSRLESEIGSVKSHAASQLEKKAAEFQKNLAKQEAKHSDDVRLIREEIGRNFEIQKKDSTETHERITRELAELRSSLEARIQGLETHLTQEIKTLSNASVKRENIARLLHEMAEALGKN